MLEIVGLIISFIEILKCSLIQIYKRQKTVYKWAENHSKIRQIVSSGTKHSSVAEIKNQKNVFLKIDAKPVNDNKQLKHRKRLLYRRTTKRHVFLGLAKEHANVSLISHSLEGRKSLFSIKIFEEI